MTESKRYYQRDFEELYYIIDSEKISEEEFDERVMYDGYSAFEDSLTGEEIVDLLNENEQLKSENENLKSNIDDLLNQELDDRDIVCQAGKFRLEEWGKHRYHQFYNGDESLEDESIVIMLMEQSKENEQLKKELDCFKPLIFETDGMPITLYEKKDGGDVE